MHNFQEAMTYIEDASRFGSVLGLENTEELMKRLENPQDKLRFIHVAGTNGKGSTCSYISAILKEAGYRVGRYISPTVFGYLERIQLENQWISEEDFTKQLGKVKTAVDSMLLDGLPQPTVFEIETAVAFLEFLEKKCEVVVLEVGLGGRLDATNVIRTVDCAVICSISMDHMMILGDTLEKIASEKAGIIKEGVSVVSYQQEAEADKVLKEVCREKKASLHSIYSYDVQNVRYNLEKTRFQCNQLLLETQMLGENQVKNAQLAVAAAEVLMTLGYSIAEDDIIRGIKSAKWQGRFSIVHESPCVIVDGAHNEAAAISLKRSERLYFKGRRIIRILGIFTDKEYEKIVKETVDAEDTVVTIQPPVERGLEAEMLADCARKYCYDVACAKSMQEALQMALKKAEREDVIMVYGSLSFLKEVYDYFAAKG